MSPEPPALLRLLTRAAVLSLVGAIILLAGIWAVEHYGIKVLLFLWAILFLIVALHAGPSLQMPQFTKESHPALKLSQLSTLPQGQLFADAESMRTARREVGRLINVEGRRDAELQHMINSKDENEARLAIQAMKEEGTWPYYALSLLQLGLGSEVRLRQVNSILLDEGAYLSRYDDSYKPATFSSLRFFQPAMLDTSLLERMIALGCDINDRDIGGSNLIESIIEHFGDRCKVYGSLMSSESASPYLQAIEQLLDLKSEVSPQHVAQLQDYATRLTFGSEEKVQILINRIKCDHGAALLDQKTQVASAIPRAARL